MELSRHEKGLIAGLIESPGFKLLQKLSEDLISKEQEFISANVLDCDKSIAQSNRAIGRIEGIRELAGYPESLVKG